MAVVGANVHPNDGAGRRPPALATLQHGQFCSTNFVKTHADLSTRRKLEKFSKLISRWGIISVFILAVVGNFNLNAGLIGDSVSSAGKDENAQTDYYQRGVAACNNGEWNKAIINLSEAIRINPTNLSAFHCRGAAYAMSGDFKAAATDFKKVIRFEPTNAPAYLDLGSAYRGLHEWNKAIAAYTDCLQYCPTNDLAYKGRAASYASKDQPDRSILDWNDGLRLNPEDAYALAGRGAAYSVVGDYDKSLRDYKAAIQLDPTNPAACNGYAWLRATSPIVQMRNGLEAVDYAKKACELTKWSQWQSIDTLAAACAEAGDFQKALKYQKQALSFDGIELRKQHEMQLRLTLYEGKQPFRAGPSK
jgi:tetratricopeptide (TPR) repeat protein